MKERCELLDCRTVDHNVKRIEAQRYGMVDIVVARRAVRDALVLDLNQLGAASLFCGCRCRYDLDR